MIKSHQPSGLRWFRFKTLPIFQLGGLPFPLPPSLGCGSRRSRGGIGSFFCARFEPPFFHHLGPPKSLSQVISAPKCLRFEAGSQTGSHFGIDFFSSVCRFRDFLHTTSSASRIMPAIFIHSTHRVLTNACHIQTTFSPL